MTEHWYDDHRNLASLWTWLVNTSAEPDDPAYFMEKPWKWEEDWLDYTTHLAIEAAAVAAAGPAPRCSAHTVPTVADDDHPF